MIEQNTNRLWFTVGSIIVGAVIIFMMRDSVGGVVNNVFGGLDSVIGDVINDPNHIEADREDATDLYARIRNANESRGETEVWVRARKLNDGTLQIVSSSISDSSYGTGSSVMTGSLIIPDTINGMKITSIGTSAFRASIFNGKLKLPDGLRSIGDNVFSNSAFSGELNLPSGLTSIGFNAFNRSTFSGELKLPSSLMSIRDNAFERSTFNGELKLPDSLMSIGFNAFRQSTFSGELILPNGLTAIGTYAFSNSTFSGELKLPSSLTNIGGQAFRASTFSGTLDVSNVIAIHWDAFSLSKIEKVIRGDVEMSDGSTVANTSGIHPRSIRLANGSWYDGYND